MRSRENLQRRRNRLALDCALPEGCSMLKGDKRGKLLKSDSALLAYHHETEKNSYYVVTIIKNYHSNSPFRSP